MNFSWPRFFAFLEIIALLAAMPVSIFFPDYLVPYLIGSVSIAVIVTLWFTRRSWLPWVRRIRFPRPAIPAKTAAATPTPGRLSRLWGWIKSHWPFRRTSPSFPTGGGLSGRPPSVAGSYRRHWQWLGRWNWWSDVKRLLIIAVFLYTLSLIPGPIGGAILGILVGFVVLSFAIPLIPGAVNLLSNDPNSDRPDDESTYEPNTFAFFTFLEPGQIKAIVRGQHFRRMIMRFEDHIFAGEKTGADIDPNESEYWDVEETDKAREQDSHPIPVSLRRGLTDIVWLWSRFVYRLTGAVFTGIPPWQTVKVYPIERLKQHLKKPEERKNNEDMFWYERVRDYSDHVRAADFQFYVLVPSAETKDMVRIQVPESIILQTENPYRAIYGTDNWPSRVFTAVTAETADYVRGYGYKDILAKDPNQVDSHKKGISGAVMRLKTATPGKSGRVTIEGLPKIGIKIKSVEVLNPDVTDQALAASLADEAKSIADANATRNRSVGEADARRNMGGAEADATKAMIDTIKAGGTIGQQVLERETLIRTAAAAGAKGSVILNTGGATKVDPNVELLRQSIKETA